MKTVKGQEAALSRRQLTNIVHISKIDKQKGLFRPKTTTQCKQNYFFA